ncbi:MAG: glutamate--tRNA ligase, partial [Propionicimonas sp.]|nr:glutamate--tRNA ligase [Propionicimonas sp.]
RAVPLIQERLVTLDEALGKLQFLFTPDDELAIAEDSRAGVEGDAQAVLVAAVEALEGLEAFDHESLQQLLRARLVDGLGLKPKFAFAPVRVAITGSRVSPPLFESMELLGRESCLVRLRAALA